ncbi:endoglucanase [Rhizobium sp. RU20A]|uniref:glycoside hydrolase family 9 protein n=1 Tax=Rhizobium sp. RU20A TaxID=1907412 RepID=UPI000953C34B|nr:glycoside hydrolase family 9 protein [Rhizobium sp. RU20A]SIQ27953.1 endoglucanase [Rhizobium sp. RU20A]
MALRLPACLLFSTAIVAIASPLLAAGPGEMVADGGFSEGSDAFWASDGVTARRDDGRLCLTVPAGGEPWDRLAGMNGLRLTPGQSYRLGLSLSSRPAGPVTVRVQRDGEPYSAHADETIEAKPVASTVDKTFRAVERQPAQLLLQLGGQDLDRTVCIDDVSLTAAAPAGTVTTSTTASAVLVNQSGYFRDGPKRATIVSDAAEPLDFQLVDADGAVVAEGRTRPVGLDPNAGVAVHVADFSDAEVRGEGFRLTAGGATSETFPIGLATYGRLRVDALSWFTLQRSGIAIEPGFADPAYQRAAGHLGLSPNEGDTDVGCLDGAVARSLYGDWRCDYRLDVSGGWYDAGDHGKYVVTGALSVAQLMSAYERGIAHGGGASPVVSDTLGRLPENGNSVPDILDEARWELEFLLKMQVPDGAPLAGMVHHKVHDTAWTGLPMLPADDPKPRALHRPSTAATYGFAAAAAMGARLFADIDADFAGRLRQAALTAHAAAIANPGLNAPSSDGMQGGGDYSDDNAGDEAYWAATELFLTTGEAGFLEEAKRSPFWGSAVFAPQGAYDWANVAGFARLQLAAHGEQLPAADRRAVTASVVSAARAMIEVQDLDPFGQVYRPGADGYSWGSNHAMLQNMTVLAAAYDLTGQAGYLAAVREGMDYILGRNILGLSYITGYGAHYSQNQHSRWYARQLDDDLPPPPPGTLAGGPNGTLLDDVAKEKLQGCAPQACYIDDIMSWGTNEMAINWNAPLFAVASFLADAR